MGILKQFQHKPPTHKASKIFPSSWGVSWFLKCTKSVTQDAMRAVKGVIFTDKASPTKEKAKIAELEGQLQALQAQVDKLCFSQQLITNRSSSGPTMREEGEKLLALLDAADGSNSTTIGTRSSMPNDASHVVESDPRRSVEQGDLRPTLPFSSTDLLNAAATRKCGTGSAQKNMRPPTPPPPSLPPTSVVAKTSVPVSKKPALTFSAKDLLAKGNSLKRKADNTGSSSASSPSSSTARAAPAQKSKPMLSFSAKDLLGKASMLRPKSARLAASTTDKESIKTGSAKKTRSATKSKPISMQSALKKALASKFMKSKAQKEEEEANSDWDEA